MIEAGDSEPAGSKMFLALFDFHHRHGLEVVNHDDFAGVTHQTFTLADNLDEVTDSNGLLCVHA